MDYKPMSLLRDIIYWRDITIMSY